MQKKVYVSYNQNQIALIRQEKKKYKKKHVDVTKMVVMRMNNVYLIRLLVYYHNKKIVLITKV